MAGLIALGIDLGTTYSLAATMVPGARIDWSPRVLANPLGRELTPSVVYFDPKENNVVIGEHALQLWREEPTNVIRWVKRRMGDPNYRFMVSRNGNREHFTPQQISSYVLKYVLEYAHQRAPDSRIDTLVITVPAFFGDNERQATIDSARLLGMEPILIEEPTAAILDYLHEKLNENWITPEKGDRYFAVFDLGGGTFDISIALLTWEGTNPVIKIISTQGHRQLGGFDFDLDLTEIALNKFIGGYPIYKGVLANLIDGLCELRETGTVSDSNTWELLVDLIDSVENSKRMLNSLPARRLYMPHCSAIPGGRLNVYLNQDDIDVVLNPRLIEIKERVDLALASAKENSGGELDSWEKLDGIIMVGGSTRIPAVRDLASSLFGQTPRLDSHEDQAVARGAAIYAGIKSGLGVKGSFQRKTVHSYGIIDGDTFHTIIPRGTPYPPAEAKVNYTINHVLSPKTYIQVGQAISKPEGKEDYEHINKVEYYHPVLYSGDKLLVTLSIDDNGLLQIKAKDYTGEQVEEKLESIALSEEEKNTQRDHVERWPLKFSE